MRASARATEEFEARSQALRERLGDRDFLRGKGLGNEVAIFMFCYDPALELRARELFSRLKADESLPCRIVEKNLYDVMLERLREKRLLDRMADYERRRGREGVERQIRRICTPEDFARACAYEPREDGDVLLITGVGEAYPFVRLHTLLESLQPLVSDVPIVAAYPGRFDGKTLSLFGKLPAENYYRAFDLA
jgi:hypothetical protein